LFDGYGLALAALALVFFGAIECPPTKKVVGNTRNILGRGRFYLEFKLPRFSVNEHLILWTLQSGVAFEPTPRNVKYWCLE